jgi:ubiquinone/menaquinone biosynthesis C-methylase UbiE
MISELARNLRSRWLLRLENFPTPRHEIDRLRAEVLREVSGFTIEIGFGTGLNLPHLSSKIREYVGIDPEPEGGALTEARLKSARFPVMLVKAPAENLPFQDDTFDSAISTWTLCSLKDPLLALRELHRVLKPEGRLYFIEHGRAPSAWVGIAQSAWSPIQRRIADGCRVDRDISALLLEGGFKIEKIEENHLAGPQVLTFTSRGFATRIN